ncbi:hypothetical protein [Capnocytophaga gingivalis]|uniref:Uncharacterized protein n=1 Tax=Capnocytophaga gingivalis TaxID=1017 RepID=A0ABU5YC32_9FLAO|nr:hypothetical protein [Capnocytophaga gingivalis]MEB3041523.1 hypothetical protein [Capnocytophaga gingivalis]
MLPLSPFGGSPQVGVAEYVRGRLPFGDSQRGLTAGYASLHFAKVLIARRATTFGKVDYSDNQLFFGYIVEAFCKRPHK